MSINSNNQKLNRYVINLEFLISSFNIVNGNILNIPININKTQIGTENLFIGKKITVFIYDKILTGTYQQKTDNTEYLRINNITQISEPQIEFNANTIFQYNDISGSYNDSEPVTINDIKKYKTTKNSSDYKGVSGLLEPLHLEAIESVKFIKEISQKSISELLSYTTTIYYESLNIDNTTQIQFGLFHSLFNVEFELKTFGSNYTIKALRYGSSELLNNLSVNITINIIPSNDASKKLYQILVKLINVPVSIQSNVEKIKCYINENLTKQTVYATLPINYTLTNSVLYINDKTFSRYILYYDNNGVVSLNPQESIKLLGNQNLNNILNFGWYHYDTLNLGDSILTNLPTGFKNIFSLNVKRVSDELLVQYLYIYDSTNNVIKTFSRLRNNTTLQFTSWIEYVTSNHKHPAKDIITDNSNLFVTKEQIDLWNSYQVSLSDYWNNAVATKVDLPKPALNGESRLCLADMKIYAYLSSKNDWTSLTDTKLTLDVKLDYVKILINGGGSTANELILPEVTNNNPGLVPADFNSTDWKNLFETNLNFTTENTGTDVPGFYSKQLDYSFTILDSDTKKLNDGTTHYIYGTNGETRIIDLNNISDKINKTLYSVYDNQNILSGIVNSYQFILIPGYYLTNKLLFSSTQVVNIFDENGIKNLHNQLNYILTAVGFKYIIKIEQNTINIYKIKIN